MDSEIYSFALKSTLNEIQHICPDVKNSFMFTEEGEIIAANEATSEKVLVQVVNAFDGIMEKAEALGGIEGIVLDGNNGMMNVIAVNDFYLVTVSSKTADKKLVDTVTRILVPTVLKLLEKISPTPLKNTPLTPKKEHEILTPATTDKGSENEDVTEPRIREPEQHPEPEPNLETTLPEPQVSQLIVENMGGLLVPSDTVRIDADLLSQWEESCDGRKIEMVEIETFGGKSIQCKVRQIKDAKYEGKGIMQMPEKIQLTLEIRKGELIRVKPVIQ
jgi:hypothetical protein